MLVRFSRERCCWSARVLLIVAKEPGNRASNCWFANSVMQHTQSRRPGLTRSRHSATWYVRVRGDFAGRVSGAVYEVNGGDDERKLDVQASARTCTRAQAGQARHAYVL